MSHHVLYRTFVMKRNSFLSIAANRFTIKRVERSVLAQICVIKRLAFAALKRLSKNCFLLCCLGAKVPRLHAKHYIHAQEPDVL